MRDKLEKQNDEQRQIETFFYHVVKNVDNTTRYTERQKKKNTKKLYHFIKRRKESIDFSNFICQTEK